MKSSNFIIYFGIYFMVCAGRLTAAEVMVFAAASLTDALKQIGGEYQENSGGRVFFNFAGSSTLARQISAGAPADIFFSADEAKMDTLQKQGLIDEATRKNLLGNWLAVIVPSNSTLKIQSASDFTNASVARIALADPEAVPAGVYARMWLGTLHLWSVVRPKIVPTSDVRAALAAVESGNVDAGVVFQTDAAISRKVKVVFKVSGGKAPAIRYPVALIKGGPQPEAAKKFLEYLESAKARAVFEHYGFSPGN